MGMKWVSSGKKKRAKHFADYIIYLSVAAILGYTVAAVALQFSGAMELSPTLTTCWYAFWTVEIVALATIKISKVRSTNGYKKEEENAGQ